MSIEAERWRYVTVRECRKALTEAVPSEFDPRAKLKRGFMDNKLELVRTIHVMLNEMVEYNTSDAQKVEQLIKQLMNLWLEYGMYRCRLVLFMSQPYLQSAKEKARQAEGGNLILTIAPGLKRYGNVEGVELHSSTIVFEEAFFDFQGHEDDDSAS